MPCPKPCFNRILINTLELLTSFQLGIHWYACMWEEHSSVMYVAQSLSFFVSNNFVRPTLLAVTFIEDGLEWGRSKLRFCGPKISMSCTCLAVVHLVRDTCVNTCQVLHIVGKIHDWNPWLRNRWLEFRTPLSPWGNLSCSPSWLWPSLRNRWLLFQTCVFSLQTCVFSLRSFVKTKASRIWCVRDAKTFHVQGNSRFLNRKKRKDWSPCGIYVNALWSREVKCNFFFIFLI